MKQRRRRIRNEMLSVIKRKESMRKAFTRQKRLKEFNEVTRKNTRTVSKEKKNNLKHRVDKARVANIDEATNVARVC
jgi:hypothetical protein